MAIQYDELGNVINSTTPDPLLENRTGKRPPSVDDRSKYKIDQYMYPIDLMGQTEAGKNQYGGNMVMFYINTSIESKLVKGKSDSEFVSDIAPRERGDLVGQEYGKSALAAAAIGGATSGGIVGSLFGGGRAGAAAGAAAGGATAAYVMPTGGKFTRPQKRLSTAIALHMPNQMQIRYGMNYSDEDLLNASALAAGMGTGAVAGAVAGGVAGKLGRGKAGGGAAAGAAVGAALSNPEVGAALGLANLPGGAALSVGSGLAANPKKEQVFKSVDFRTFMFDYQFFPRSEKEAENVLNIIKMFKLHMHPEYKDERGFLFIYPSEFDIYYYAGTDLNKAIHKHTSCVLTELTVNYTPQGQFTAFANGMPTQININMTFKELAILTKDKIEQGF